MNWKIIHFNHLESTNKTAESYPVGSVIVADTQSGGHGRYGRHWESPFGNLYMSVVLDDYGYQTPLLSFIAGLAVAQALSDFSVRLKWPNDVLRNGKKMAGILLERTESGSVIMGIGVNVVSHPTQNMLYETASLEGMLTVDDVLNRILKTLTELLYTLKTEGFPSIRKKWISLADGIGQQIKVNLPNQQVVGVFKELSQEGALLLQLPDNSIRKITAGDVFLL